uniref:DAGKc domain-containing protein n=1 Tax=Cucumis melo TaxID=3656 RepID=A0A9I9DWV5_CUCME
MAYDNEKGGVIECLRQDGIVDLDSEFLSLSEWVFDLLDVKPYEFVQYGLCCLEILVDHGDVCAKKARQKIRIMVAGGDGTVGWAMGSLTELYKQDHNPVLPVGIIPHGTGNGLAKSFDWVRFCSLNSKFYRRASIFPFLLELRIVAFFFFKQGGSFPWWHSLSC